MTDRSSVATEKRLQTKPLVSIITVVYNAEEYLEETIQSVIGQTFKNIEYIIIDGGSTDGTFDIIKKYEHAIDYYISEKDEGIYDAMNKGIEAANGEWINFMNGGDTFHNSNVLQSLSFPNKPDCDLLSGKVALYYKKSFLFLYGNEEIRPHQALFFKSKYLKKHHFNTKYKIIADGMLTQQLLSLYPLKSCFVDIIVSDFELGGIGNHPKYLFKKLKEIINLKQESDQKLDIKFLIFCLLSVVEYGLYKIFGEHFYYKCKQFKYNLFHGKQ